MDVSVVFSPWSCAHDSFVLWLDSSLCFFLLDMHTTWPCSLHSIWIHSKAGLQPCPVKRGHSLHCPLGHPFSILLKCSVCIQCLLDGFAKLLIDNQFVKVIIWAVTFQTVNYKVWPFDSHFDITAINYSF